MKTFMKIFFAGASLLLIQGCARDLSSNVYTSEETVNLTLEGKIISSRPIIVKNHDKVANNSTGLISGGAAGGVLAGAAAHGGAQNAAIVGGVLAGSIVGMLIESSLSTADGIEYIIKVDTSRLSDKYFEGSLLMRNAMSSVKATGLLTVVQGKDSVLNVGQEVYVILSPKRARVIPSTHATVPTQVPLK